MRHDGCTRVITGPTFYLDPNGSDSGDGSYNNPWLTTTHAQAVIEAGGYLTNPTADVSLLLKPGDYWLGENGNGQVALTDADSGKGAWNFVIGAYGGKNTVRLLGGKRVTGWSLYSGSIYRAAVSGSFYTMYENGVRGIMARTPAFSADASFPMARAPYLTAAGVAASQTIIQYAPGDLTTPNLWDLTTARIVDYSGGASSSGGSRSWFTDDIPIQSVNTGSRQLTLSASTIYNIFDAGVGGRYFAQGDLAMLTGAGQWYHDTVGGWLYYWPRNTPIASQEIVIPTMQTAFNVAGSSTSNIAKNIVIQNLEIAFTDYAQTFQASQSTQDTGAVKLTNTSHVVIDRCNIHSTGLAGIWVHSYGKQNSVTNSWIHNTGSHGVLFENYVGVSPDIGDVNNNHVLSNVRANNIGELFAGANGLMLANVGSTTFQFFDVYNTTRAAVTMLGYNADDTKNYASNNLIQYGKGHAVMQDSGDNATFYTSELKNAASTWNQLTSDNSAACASMTDLLPSAMYTDNRGGGQVISNVWATNTAGSVRVNNGAASIETNVSWGTFNSALMDTWNIGVRGDFPY